MEMLVNSQQLQLLYCLILCLVLLDVVDHPSQPERSFQMYSIHNMDLYKIHYNIGCVNLDRITCLHIYGWTAIQDLN